MKRAIATAALTAVVTAVPAGAAGAIYGIHYMEKHMLARDTPTGRQADSWRDANLEPLIRRQVNLAIDCQERIGNPWCLDEYGGDWPPPF